MAAVTVIVLAILLVLIFAMVRSIRNERTEGRSVWREFSLGLILMILFFVSWAAQGVVQWQTFTDEQHEHGETVEVGDFMAEFGQSTLENWQSEFLQLFSFVVLAALYIHKGSAESKDSDEKMEAALRRIEQHLGTLPATAPADAGETWKLPETPLEQADRSA
jgi:dipeptide/tripeptide permease